MWHVSGMTFIKAVLAVLAAGFAGGVIAGWALALIAQKALRPEPTAEDFTRRYRRSSERLARSFEQLGRRD